MSTLRHHRKLGTRWGDITTTACGQAVPTELMASRWTETTCPECRASHGFEPASDQRPDGPTAGELIRIGIVLEKLAGASWPLPERTKIAHAAWAVVTKILSERKTAP